MAGKLSPATPRSKIIRGSGVEMERTPLSGKAAFSMFGDNSPKILKRAPLSRGAELSQVQEELSKTKEQLALLEKSRSNLLQDLARSKRQVEEMAAKLQDVTDVSEKDRIRADEMEHASFTAAEDWQIELEVVKQQYEAAVVELEANRDEMVCLKHELIMSTEAKNEAVRLAGEAMNAAETTAKRVEELSAEVVAARKARIVNEGPSSVKTDEVKTGVLVHDGDCGESRQDTSLLLAVKEIELEKAVQETKIVKAELESLKSELALAQASHDEHAHGSALLLVAKESELDNAMKESKQARSEITALKQELALGKAACEESAQSNYLILAAKESEIAKALQEANLAQAELEGVEQQLALSQELQLQHMSLSSAMEQLQKDFASTKELKIKYEIELGCLNSDVDQLSHDLTYSREKEKSLISQLTEINAANEKVVQELVKARKSEEEASVAASSALANYDKCNAELAMVRNSESATVILTSKLYLELEDLEGKLCRTTLEETFLISLLDTLREDLEKSQEQQESLRKKEVSMDFDLQNLNLKLANTSRLHAEEVGFLNSRIASSQAALEDVRPNYERQKLDLMSLVDKEAAAQSNIKVLEFELEQALNESVELRRQQSIASERGVMLAIKMESTKNELTALKEKELSLACNVSSLIDDLKVKSSEVADFKKRATMAEDRASLLTSNLEHCQSELALLKEREHGLNSKATALSVALAFLSANTETRLLELKHKEELADVKAAALHDELRRMTIEFESAVSAAKQAQEKSAGLHKSLAKAESDRELAMQNMQVAREEAARDKDTLEGTLREAEAAQDELFKASEVHAAEQRAHIKAAQEAKILEERLQTAQQDTLQARVETDEVRELLQRALMDAQKLGKELDEEWHESSILKKEIADLRALVLTTNEQANAARKENEIARGEIEILKTQAEQAKLAEDVAESMYKSAELRLQNALFELETVRSHASLVQQKDKQQPDTGDGVSLSEGVLQEELNKSKLKLEDAESRLASAMGELQISNTTIEQLSEELEAVKLVKDSNEKEVVEVQRLLADTENAKANMEAEIQRLLDCSKLWQGAKDAIDKPVHPEMNGCNAFECRDEKPLPDNLEELPTYVLSACEANGKAGVLRWEDHTAARDGTEAKEEQASASVNRLDSSDLDEGFVKDDGALHDDSLALPIKRRKKNLLGRLGTLLDKKKF